MGGGLSQRSRPRADPPRFLTYAEVYEGIYYGTDRRRHEQGFRDFLQAVVVLPLTRRSARRYAALRGRLQREGQILDQPDLFIAATAVQYSLVLVTRNRQHFERIPNLQLH